MKKASFLMTGAFVGTACLMMAGCQPKEEPKAELPTATQAEEKVVEKTEAAEKAVAEQPEAAKPEAAKPEAAKPMDHPAH